MLAGDGVDSCEGAAVRDDVDNKGRTFVATTLTVVAIGDSDVVRGCAVWFQVGTADGAVDDGAPDRAADGGCEGTCVELKYEGVAVAVVRCTDGVVGRLPKGPVASAAEGDTEDSLVVGGPDGVWDGP